MVLKIIISLVLLILAIQDFLSRHINGWYLILLLFLLTIDTYFLESKQNIYNNIFYFKVFVYRCISWNI